jgi:hypothetical protein
VADLIPEEVAPAISVSAYGGFLVAQQAARLMAAEAILLTGAPASVKGYLNSSAFAMGKFSAAGCKAWLGNCPPRARTSRISRSTAAFAVHRPDPNDSPDNLLVPDAIAETYWHRKPAAQCLDLGCRTAALGGGELLSRASFGAGNFRFGAVASGSNQTDSAVRFEPLASDFVGRFTRPHGMLLSGSDR